MKENKNLLIGLAVAAAGYMYLNPKKKEKWGLKDPQFRIMVTKEDKSVLELIGGLPDTGSNGYVALADSPHVYELSSWVFKNLFPSGTSLYENFPKKRKIRFTTVQTLLRRLEKKGYLKHRLRGNANIYYAAVNMESVLKRTVNDFLERVFGGDPVPLMMYLAKHGKLTTQDIKNLMELVEEE